MVIAIVLSETFEAFSLHKGVMGGKFETLREGATYLRARETLATLDARPRRSDVIQNKQTNNQKNTHRYFETC